jgi:WD40 repeat protein
MLTPRDRPAEPWLRSFGPAEGRFEAVMIHPDGRRLIGIERDATVTVWNIADGRRLHHFTPMLSDLELEETRGVYLRLHPDGVRLFAISIIVDTSDVSHCWNLDTGELVDRFEYPKIPSLFLDDRLAVTAHGLNLTMWDFVSGDQIHRELRHDASWSLYGAIGEHVVAGGRTGIELWQLRHGRKVWSKPGHAAAVTRDLVVIADAGELVLRDLDGSVVRRIAHPLLEDGSWSLACVDNTAAVANQAQIVVIDLLSGALRTRFDRPPYGPFKLHARDLCIWAPIDRAGSVWSLTTGECRLRAAEQLVLSPDGAHAASCDDRHLRWWSVDGSDHRERIAGWYAIAANPLVAIDRQRTIHLVDPPHTWTIPEGRVALSAGRIALLHAGTLSIRDARTGAELHAIATRARSIALANDLVATASTEVEVFRGGASIARFSTRGTAPEVLALSATRAAVADDLTVELWRLEPPLRLHTFKSLTEPHCAAFDDTGQWLVSGHQDGALLVRDLRERTHHLTIETGAGSIRSIALRGTRIAVCANVAVSIWDLVTGARLDDWSDDAVLDVAWIDDHTLACATERGLVVLGVE